MINHFNIAKQHIDAGNTQLAINSLTSALAKHPENPELRRMLGDVYFHCGDIRGSIEHYSPLQDPFIYFRLGYLYYQLLDSDKGDYYLELAYKHNKNIALQYEIIGAILFNFNYKRLPYTAYKARIDNIPELRLNFAGKYTSWKKSNSHKIRLGFVSGDLREHSVSFFLESLLKHIDRTKYELYAFPTEDIEDSKTAHLRRYFDVWQTLDMRQSMRSAEIVHSSAVDILFDLSGHTAKNGLLVFKYKPCQIQVSWLGYFASTGIPEMDYFISSKPCIMDSEREFFTEQVLRLPETYLSYHNSYVQQQRPNNNYTTFGFFQNLSKVSAEDLQLWSAILTEIPDARLVIKSMELSDAAIKERFAAHFPDMSRVELRGKTNLAEHMIQHNDIDVMLDAYNISGCTTTCQSLYMGVPIIAFRGVSMLTRHGEQFLTAVGLSDYVCDTAADAVNLAKKLASNIESVRQLDIRARVLNSSIGNGALFTAQFEHLLGRLVEHHNL